MFFVKMKFALSLNIFCNKEKKKNTFPNSGINISSSSSSSRERKKFKFKYFTPLQKKKGTTKDNSS